MINKEQFHELYLEHYSGVKSFFLYKGFPREEAEELTQEVFFRVYKNRKSFQGRSNFRSWVNAISNNLWKNTIRDSKTQKKDGIIVPYDPGSTEADYQIQDEKARKPLEGMIDDQHRELLRNAITKLPEKIRHCLILRLHHDLSYKEIATVLQIKKDTVKSRLHQAQASLKHILDKKIHINFMDR